MKLCPEICLDAGNGALDGFRDDFFDMPISIQPPEKKPSEGIYTGKVWKNKDRKKEPPALF